jgi:hypothetical protein
MSSASPAPLLSSEPSDKLLAPASPDSPLPLKRTWDRPPSDRAGKRAKVKARTNKRTWDEARDPDEERGEKARDSSYHDIWYCKHCDSSKKPQLGINKPEPSPQAPTGLSLYPSCRAGRRSDLKKQQHGTITDMFGRQEERQTNRDLDEEKYLVNAVNIPAFEEALSPKRHCHCTSSKEATAGSCRTSFS